MAWHTDVFKQNKLLGFSRLMHAWHEVWSHQFTLEDSFCLPSLMAVSHENRPSLCVSESGMSQTVARPDYMHACA